MNEAGHETKNTPVGDNRSTKLESRKQTLPYYPHCSTKYDETVDDIFLVYLEVANNFFYNKIFANYNNPFLLKPNSSEVKIVKKLLTKKFWNYIDIL